MKLWDFADNYVWKQAHVGYCLNSSSWCIGLLIHVSHLPIVWKTINHYSSPTLSYSFVNWNWKLQHNELFIPLNHCNLPKASNGHGIRWSSDSYMYLSHLKIMIICLMVTFWPQKLVCSWLYWGIVGSIIQRPMDY